mmetsp:Transcript_42170/g.75693  ORF Transcript_42170/g.75693 Transcript_42170/m.75693 type:complete len:184 (-) Transcript_42170:148-699(-)
MTSSDEERQQRRDELDELCTGYKSSKFPSCPEVEPRELWESMNASDTTSEGKKFVIVDTRREEEHKVSMLPGSVTQREFETRREAHSNSTVYCYCTVGYRSGIYADKLRREGLEAVNLRGSIVAWTQEGLPLVKREHDGTETQTKQVHAFGKQWAHLCGADYSAVYFHHPIVKAVGQMFGGLW